VIGARNTADSPLWTTLWHFARILLFGTLLGVVLFAIYLGLAYFGI
jgi:hypothetical protein